jgi:hypothetical protein
MKKNRHTSVLSGRNRPVAACCAAAARISKHVLADSASISELGINCWDFGENHGRAMARFYSNVAPPVLIWDGYHLEACEKATNIIT